MPHHFRLGFNPGCLIALSYSLMLFQAAFSCPVKGLTGWPHKQGTQGRPIIGHIESRTQHREIDVIWLSVHRCWTVTQNPTLEVLQPDLSQTWSMH